MSQSTIHSWFSTCPVRRDNIVWHWEQASRQEIERGMRWYADARHVATVIADGDAHLGAGMLAVYSPQQAWIGNVLLAARVLRAGQGLGGPGSGVFASTAQRRAADRLLAGESYEDILTGPKVRDFAHLIEHGGDRDPATPRVVIDRHALSVACGRALTVAEYGAAPLKGYRRTDGSISCRHYDHVVQLYRNAAGSIARRDHYRVAAHQVQAVTWLVRQRLNQHAERGRGASVLDTGRTTARARAEQRWHTSSSTTSRTCSAARTPATSLPSQAPHAFGPLRRDEPRACGESVPPGNGELASLFQGDVRLTAAAIVEGVGAADPCNRPPR